MLDEKSLARATDIMAPQIQKLVEDIFGKGYPYILLLPGVPEQPDASMLTNIHDAEFFEFCVKDALKHVQEEEVNLRPPSAKSVS